MIVREIWTTRPAPSSAPMAPVFFVPWNEVPDHMHIREKMPTADSLTDDAGANVSLNKRNTSGADTFSEGNNGLPAGKNDAKSSGASYASSYIEDKELEEIFLREFGSKKQQEDRYRGVPERSRPFRSGSAGQAENDGSGNFSRTKGNDYIRSPKRIQSRNFEIFRQRRNAVWPQRGKTVSAGGRLQYHLCLGFF